MTARSLWQPVSNVLAPVEVYHSEANRVLTSERESDSLLSCSCAARSRPCRMPGPSRRRHRETCAMRSLLRGPVNTTFVSECAEARRGGRRTKNAAAAMPVPHASTDAIFVVEVGSDLSGEKMSWVKMECRLQGTFSTSRSTGLAWLVCRSGNPCSNRPAQPPYRMLIGFPPSKFRETFGGSISVEATLNLEAYHTQQDTACLVVQDAVCYPTAP